MTAEAQVSAAASTSHATSGGSVRWIAPTVPLDHQGPTLPYERVDANFLGRPIYELFESVAARNEDAPALADRAGTLTYAQVRSAARRLAADISAATPAQSAVAVLLPNSAISLIATLACFAAGRVCVLLNADHPAERNRAILRRAGVRAVVLDNDDAAALIPANAVRVLVARDGDESIGDAPVSAAALRPDDPAIVLYTSGSTGEPKGIVLSQAALLWRARIALVSDHFVRDDRLLSLGALCTTAGLGASFSALLSGCLQFIVSVAAGGATLLLSLIRDERVTILRGVPGLLRMLFELDGSGETFAHLRIVRTYGEHLPRADLVKWRAMLPTNCHIGVTYGQTEGYASAWFVPPGRVSGLGAVPVGYLLPEQHYAIVDEAGSSVASGEVGELIVKSRYVALGEWEDGQCKPSRAQPDATDPGSRRLSTGDFARLDADSVLHIVGRQDRQVKINGQRVEPAEIEDVLRRAAGVAAAAVAVSREGEEAQLLGFVVTEDSDEDAVRGRVRAVLKQALPTYMHPTRLFLVERLPLLPGGKVDAAALLKLAAATPRRRLPQSSS